jgi:hypothetical protein
MNPSEFQSNIESEQQKIPGQCLYHLTTSHGTAGCHDKKECDKLLASTKGTSVGSQNSTTAPSTGQLRHLTEEIFEVAVDLADSKDESFETVDNDTNDSDLLYFAHVSNHYLQLVSMIQISQLYQDT